MGRHILFALLSGLLVMGLSTAFAEGPQLSDQAVLQAWGQTQMAAEQVSDPLTPEGPRGLKPLTDEELQQIAGAGMPDLVFSTLAFGRMPEQAKDMVGDKFPGSTPPPY